MGKLTGTHVIIERDDAGEPQRLLYGTTETPAPYTIEVESHTTGRDVTHPERTLPTGHLACPFCGSAAGIVPYVDYGVWKYRIGCDACDTAGGLYPTEAAAWQAWDTRAGA